MMGAGIREAIKGHSKATIAVVAIVALGAIAISLRSAASGPPTASTQVYYTIDEGKTSFVAEMSKVPPFEHQGKPAYRVWMFTLDGGKTKFPGYLERLTPEAKKRVEAALAVNKNGAAGAPPVGLGDTEVKKPGEGNPWVSRANLAEATKVTQVPCPPGAQLDVVLPE